MTETIADRVKTCIGEILECPDDELLPNVHILNDLGADSLDIIEIVMDLEEEFDISIEDEDFEKLTTVQAVTDYVTSVTAK